MISVGTKQQCVHGSILPRGLKCDRGYLIIRLSTERGPLNQGCGPHTPAAEKSAILALDDIRVKQRLGTFELTRGAERIRFNEAAKLYQTKHYIEWRDPRTNQSRGKANIANNQSHLNTLTGFFGGFYLDAITLKDLRSYRQKRVNSDQCSAGTVNREMAVMSSLFSAFERWVAGEEIEAAKLPAKNPCRLLEDMYEEPRRYPVRIEVLKALKHACAELKDDAMWSIISTELHTSLRLNDLMKLEDAEIENGQLTITQGKTGNKINLPACAKPVWARVFVNFRARWQGARAKASKLLVAGGYDGCDDLQFRDLRKWGLQMLETQFTPEQIASKAGHTDPKITKRWYLRGTQAADLRPMVEATEKMLEAL